MATASIVRPNNNVPTFTSSVASMVIMDRINRYLYTNDLLSIITLNRSIRSSLIRYLTSRDYPHPILLRPKPKKDTTNVSNDKPVTDGLDVMDLQCLDTLTLISRYCRSTVTSITRSTGATSTPKQYDDVIMNIIEHNAISLQQMNGWGSHREHQHLTLMWTCPHLTKWTPSWSCDIRTSDQMELLYQFCPHLNHFIVPDKLRFQTIEPRLANFGTSSTAAKLSWVSGTWIISLSLI
jgi:hypothetical protein